MTDKIDPDLEMFRGDSLEFTYRVVDKVTGQQIVLDASSEVYFTAKLAETDSYEASIIKASTLVGDITVDLNSSIITVQTTASQTLALFQTQTDLSYDLQVRATGIHGYPKTVKSGKLRVHPNITDAP